MQIFQSNTFAPVVVPQHESLQIVDVFSVSGKKTITLSSHSHLTYLVVASGASIDLDVVSDGSDCSCKIFGLFAAGSDRCTAGSLTVSLNHSFSLAEVELISFLYDDAVVAIDGSIIIAPRLDTVHGNLLERNVVLGKNISLKTLPKLIIASHNISASHGATIDTLDAQKLFYMMSRGLSPEKAKKLLVTGYIDSVLDNFENLALDQTHKINQLLLS